MSHYLPVGHLKSGISRERSSSLSDTKFEVIAADWGKGQVTASQELGSLA